MQNSFHHMLMMTHLCFHRNIMDDAKKLGLTSGQPKILEFLNEHEGVEQKTIAEHCEIERASAGSILGRMESAGLIERRRVDGNRRSLYVYLTPAGREAAAKVENIFTETERRAFFGLTDEEVAALRSSLKKVYQNISGADKKM